MRLVDGSFACGFVCGFGFGFGFYDNRDNRNNDLILNSMLSVDNNKNNFYQPKGWLPLDPNFTFVALNQRSPAERKDKAQKLQN